MNARGIPPAAQQVLPVLVAEGEYTYTGRRYLPWQGVPTLEGVPTLAGGNYPIQGRYPLSGPGQGRYLWTDKQTETITFAHSTDAGGAVQSPQRDLH